MAGITSFTAETLATGSTLRFTWDFSADLVGTADPVKCSDLYIYLNTKLNDGVVRQERVVPLLDVSGNLTKTYEIANLVNGTTYLAQIEATVQTPQGVKVYTKTASGTPSTKPPKPIIMIGKDRDSGFYVKLSRNVTQIVDPVKNTADDGYTPLIGMYVIFTDGTNMNTTYVDASGDNLYKEKLQIAAPYAEYEVAVRTVNKNGSSEISDSKEIKVDSSIGPVRVVRVVEQMAIDPSASVDKSSYAVPKILLTWNAPEDIGTPALTSYTISRALVDASGNPGNFSNITSGVIAGFNNNLSYVIDSSYVYLDTLNANDAGKVYRYNIIASNVNGASEDDAVFMNSIAKVKDRSVRGVFYPVVTGFTTKPSDKQSVINTTVSGGFDPSVNHEFDVNYNGQITIGNIDKGTITGENPVTLTNLTNDVNYSITVVANMKSPNVSGVVYKSDESSSKTTTPIAAIPPVLNLSASALDASGSPLDKSVKLSWTNPSGITSFPGLMYIVERKLKSSPDASYVFDVSGSIVSGATVELQRNTLDNGKTYTYRIFTLYKNGENGEDYESTKNTVEVMPFALPPASLLMTLTAVNSSTDLSYQFIDSSLNNSGLTILGHRYRLYNLNNGLEELVNTKIEADGSFNQLRRESLSTLFGALNAGTRYTMTIETYVEVDSVKYYSELVVKSGFVAGGVSNTWTKPVGIRGTIADNVDASGVPLSTSSSNGIVRLSWNLPANHDASGISYRVLRNINDVRLNPLVRLTNSSYDITGLTVGPSAAADYYVLALMGADVSGNVSGNNFISLKTSADQVNAYAVARPPAVTGLTATNVSASRLDFSFNRVTTFGGMAAADTRYRVELIDASSEAILSEQFVNHSSSQFGSFTELVAGSRYKIRVTTQSMNRFKNLNEYVDSSTQPESLAVATYDEPMNVTNFEINPADTSIVVRWTPIGNDPAGLKYLHYSIEFKRSIDPDASFNVFRNVSPKASSSEVIATLTNGIKYDVRIRTVFTDNLATPVNKLSDYSSVLSVTPGPGPQQPGQITVEGKNNGAGMIITWPLPSDNVSHYSITVDGSNVAYHFERDNVPATSLLNDEKQVNMLEIPSGLEVGKTYVIRVYAELSQTEANVVYYTSSSASQANYTSFRNPSAPRNISARLDDKQIMPKWEAPSDTAGQNGNLQYEFYLNNTFRDTSGNRIQLPSLIVVDKDGSPVNKVSGTNRFRLTNDGATKPLDRLPLSITDPSNIIQNNKEYVFVVKSIFSDPDNANTNYESAWIELDKLFPRPAPTLPELQVKVLQGNAESTIELTMSSDPSFNLDKYEIYRRILDASSGIVLDPYAKIETKNYLSGVDGNTVEQGKRQHVITDNNLGSSQNWLNGNEMEYYVKAYYNDNNINPSSAVQGDEELDSVKIKVRKITVPYPCDKDGNRLSGKVALMEKDASNNFSYFLHKAGSDIHTVNAILIDASNVAVINVAGISDNKYTLTEMNNARVAGTTAAKQVVKVNIKVGADNADNLTDMIAVNANAVGSVLAIYPQDGVFANLRNQVPI
jgi:hypothetical protein